MQMSVNGITNSSNSYQMAFQWAFPPTHFRDLNNAMLSHVI